MDMLRWIMADRKVAIGLYTALELEAVSVPQPHKGDERTHILLYGMTSFLGAGPSFQLSHAIVIMYTFLSAVMMMTDVGQLGHWTLMHMAPTIAARTSTCQRPVTLWIGTALARLVVVMSTIGRIAVVVRTAEHLHVAGRIVGCH